VAKERTSLGAFFNSPLAQAVIRSLVLLGNGPKPVSELNLPLTE
jgi:hypothetical protein